MFDKPVTAVYNGVSHGAKSVRDGFVWLLRLPMEGIYYLLSGSAAAIEKGTTTFRGLVQLLTFRTETRWMGAGQAHFGPLQRC